MEWKWVWLVLLLLVIAAAVWLLLRRPGGTEVSGSSDPAQFHDGSGRATDAVPPTQAAGHEAYDTGAADAQAYDAGNQPYDAGGQALADAPFDQTAAPEAGYAEPAGYEQPAGDEQGTGYEQGTGDQGDSYTEPQATYQDTATGDAAAADSTYDDSTYVDDTYDDTAAPADTAYGDAATADSALGDAAATDAGYPQETTYSEPGVTYADNPTGDLTADDSAYAEGTATEAGYQEGTSYAEPEVTYEDTTYEEATYDDAADPGTGAASGNDWTAAPDAEAPDVERGGSDQWAEPAPAPDASTEEDSYQDTTGDAGVSGSTAATIGAGAAAAGAAGATAWSPADEATATEWSEGEPVQAAAEFDVAQPAVTETAATETAATETAATDTGDYGYDEAHAGAAAAANAAEAPFGAGSAVPAEDGSGPVGWEIKGNAGSMLFHTTESPSYEGTRAEVWFESEEIARAAGFAHWDRKRR